MPFASVLWMPRRKVLFVAAAYVPTASQCQMSTAALLIGLQVEPSGTVSFSVSGTPGLPSVTLRRTLSPGRKNGPSVDSGASTQETAPDATAAGPAPPASSTAFQPKAAARPAPPSFAIDARRVSRPSGMA